MENVKLDGYPGYVRGFNVVSNSDPLAQRDTPYMPWDVHIFKMAELENQIEELRFQLEEYKNNTDENFESGGLRGR